MSAKIGKMSRTISTKHLVLTGMFTAVLVVLSQISIPMPSGVPVTLQTFGVALCAGTLGWQVGSMAVGLYILLGALGLPVFSGMTGGLGILLGPTGGFLVGFLFLTYFMGRIASEKNKIKIAAGVVLGIGLCHLCGILWFMQVMSMSFIKAAVLVSLPYLAKDILSAVLAFESGKVIRRALYNAGM